MGKRSYSGGTTALVIVLTLVIILIGVGFFFGMKIIGGGNELQHATDSGNLNVAKMALVEPSMPFLNDAEAHEFGDLTDANHNNAVDLLVYDRMVGRAVAIALNAAAINTPTATAHAKEVLDMVQGPNGIGSRLACQLSQHGSHETHFTNVSQANSTRMLESSNVTANPEESAVSYMARNKASNVYITANQIPAGVNFLGKDGNVVSKNGKTYLSGYYQLDCGLPDVKPVAVPMRPGEQPHLVDNGDFLKFVDSPLGGSNSLIPPNAFRSGGSAGEGNRGGGALTMRSCAVVGTLNQDYQISAPRGYIIVDNSGSMAFNGLTGGGSTALANALMQPSYVPLVTTKEPGLENIFAEPPSGSKDVLQQISEYVNDSNNKPPVPAALLNKVASPSGMTSDQAYKAFKGTPPPTVHQCNNVNSISGGPGPIDADCVANYNRFLSYYGTKIPPTTTNAGGLMAVEAFKCYVLQVRASVGSDGCGSAVAPASCTGLKDYDIHGSYGLPCNFAAPGTLGRLLEEAPGATAIQSQLTQRMYQIMPAATTNDINCVFSSSVPFGGTSYIYLQSVDPNNPGLVLSSTPPSFPINTNAQPDGTQQIYDTGIVDLNGHIVNVPGSEGYENPWDCPALPANGQNKILWTPSSGYNNLMGVLRFMNCASGGGDWCCPC